MRTVCVMVKRARMSCAWAYVLVYYIKNRNSPLAKLLNSAKALLANSGASTCLVLTTIDNDCCFRCVFSGSATKVCRDPKRGGWWRKIEQTKPNEICHRTRLTLRSLTSTAWICCRSGSHHAQGRQLRGRRRPDSERSVRQASSRQRPLRDHEGGSRGASGDQVCPKPNGHPTSEVSVFMSLCQETPAPSQSRSPHRDF